MPPSIAVAALLLFSLGAAALVDDPLHGTVLLAFVLAASILLVRHQRWTARQALLLLLLVMICGLRGGFGARLSPGPLDPVHQLPRSDPAPEQVLEGQWIRDTPPIEGRCRGLVRVRTVDRVPAPGLSEVLLTPCSQTWPAGTMVRLHGLLRRPAAAAHPLLSSPAQRLARLGCWTQFKATAVERLGQGWVPLADARRRIQHQLSRVLGSDHGALLAALVMGGSQVALPEELRQAFRVAGLSHALAASGFHLSVLLGSVLLLARRWPRGWRLLAAGGAMALFLALAGAQASVVRAVLMGAAALLIREAGSRARPLGVLLVALVLMLGWHPAWIRDLGFQFSAAATAGLMVTAPALEARLQAWWPTWAQGLAASLAIPLAAMAWTLPLQWLHFGAMPLYALVANLLTSPLLMALTLLAMGMAVVTLLLPQGLAVLVLSLVALPVKVLAALLQWIVMAISHWPSAQMFTGRPSGWIVVVVTLAVLSCCARPMRRLRIPLLLVPLGVVAVGAHAAQRMADGVMRVEQWGRQWVLLRHRGRAAFISSSGDGLSCRVARQLGHGLGQPRFDWVAVLDPVATDQQSCWRKLTTTMVANQLGQDPLQPGQRLTSPGLELMLSRTDGRRFLVRAGRERFSMRRADLQLEPWRHRRLK